jgi:serine beta-lactamase-like protein LACTB, mitochondrial
MKIFRFQTLVLLFVLGVALIVTFVVGLFTYVNVTKKTLHPDQGAIGSVTGSNPTAKWAEAVERGRQIARAELAQQNLPGISVAVGVAGDLVWAEGLGWADLDEKVPVTPKTRFRIGTASAVLTSAAVGLLMEQDRLKLDAEIQTYLPDFKKKEWPVTLRQLMAHMGGIRTDGGDEGPFFFEHCERPVEALPTFADDSLRFEPGTEFRVSNYGWILVSAAIESVAKKPFFPYMRAQVFEPLGMTETRGDSATEVISDLTMFYFPRFGADPRYGLHDMRELDLSCYAGAMAFVSTPSDLVRFGMAINAGKLLQPATVDQLQASQRLRSGKETGYGLGWDLESETVAGRQTRVVGHDGLLLGGMLSSLVTIPEHGLVIAVTSNIPYSDTYAIALKLAEVFAIQHNASSR